VIEGVDIAPNVGQDLGAGPERAAPPCCLRLVNGGWCRLADGHVGEHSGPPRTQESAPPETLCLGRRKR